MIMLDILLQASVTPYRSWCKKKRLCKGLSECTNYCWIQGLGYPGHQRVFLACDEELSPGVGRTPKKRAAKPRERTNFSVGSLIKTWPKPETAHEKPLAPRVRLGGQSWCSAFICRKRSAFEMQFHLIVLPIQKRVWNIMELALADC